MNFGHNICKKTPDVKLLVKAVLMSQISQGSVNYNEMSYNNKIISYFTCQHLPHKTEGSQQVMLLSLSFVVGFFLFCFLESVDQVSACPRVLWNWKAVLP